MYVPKSFEMTTDEIQDLLVNHGAGDLITNTAAGLLATFLPFTYEAAAGTSGALHGHVARNNEQWSKPAAGESLVILRGIDGYVSPGWYASKAEHGRVVPTWNYVTVHVYGTLVIHDDPEWVRDAVTALTLKHEASRPMPWSVTDAPPAFISGQLAAIVGLELRITRVEAKMKLSQNRPPADIDGVVHEMREAGQVQMSEAVQAARPTN